MKLITPSFEIWEQCNKPGSLISNMWSHIARCVRVCYQSETKKNPSEGDEAFVKRVIFRNQPDNNEANHLSVLEHGTIYLKYPSYINDWGNKYFKNKYSKIITTGSNYYVTTNLRVLFENGWLDDLKYICIPTEHHEKRVTVSFNTNIGVTREFNRHRVDSVSEESTRYCNYNTKNDGELNIGLPAWFFEEDKTNQSLNRDLALTTLPEYIKDLDEYGPDFDSISQIWDSWMFYFFSLTVSEFCYNALIQNGWKPQKAREVLPLATKSQLVHTAFVSDWIHFFKLRAIGISGKPHPNAQFLAKPLMDAFIEQGIIKESDVK